MLASYNRRGRPGRARVPGAGPLRPDVGRPPANERGGLLVGLNSRALGRCLSLRLEEGFAGRGPLFVCSYKGGDPLADTRA